MHDDGEPIGRGQLDRRAEEARAFRDVVFALALFTSVVLVNGLVAIVLIALVQAVGWWEASAVEGVHEASSRVSRQFGLDV